MDPEVNFATLYQVAREPKRQIKSENTTTTWIIVGLGAFIFLIIVLVLVSSNSEPGMDSIDSIADRLNRMTAAKEA